MAVEFKDNSIEVKAALNSKTIGWLNAWANEIASHAKDNCAMDGEAGKQLRKSYRADVNNGAGEAQVGTPLEAGYWEEFGQNPVPNQNRAKSVKAKLLKIIILY